MILKSEESEIELEIKKINKFGNKNVRFIVLYGSSVKGNLIEVSDIDIAVFYQGTKKERFDFRKKILGRINIFQGLQRNFRNIYENHKGICRFQTPSGNILFRFRSLTWRENIKLAFT